MNSNVKFLHLREFEGFEGHFDPRRDGPYLCLKGGKTIAYKIEDGLLKYVVALCGRKEHFNRKLGNKIAGGRLQCEREACQRKYVKVVELEKDAHPIDTLVELEGNV